MEVALAVLADYANISREGKLNIMGVFDRIWSERFPAVYPQMQLVLRLEANPAEAGAKKAIEIQLMAEDGRRVFGLGMEMAFEVKDKTKPVGKLMKTDQIVGLQGIRFDAPGSYQFVILINAETKRTVPLEVLQIQRPATAS